MSEKKKILIVDDDASFVDSAKAVLEDKGFEVIKAFNAETKSKRRKCFLIYFSIF